MGNNTPEKDLGNTKKAKLSMSQWNSLFAALPVSVGKVLIRTLYASSYIAFFNTDEVSDFFTLGMHGVQIGETERERASEQAVIQQGRLEV